MKYELPADSLFANGWTVSASSVADVPERLKAQIREEALLDAFNQLEASLRLLLYATTPDKEPPTAERCHQILNVWRYELEHRIRLTPDTYCGAVQRYEPEMEQSYTIDGRCERGDLLRIRVPCWRMHDRVVVRGEAELLKPDHVPAGTLRLDASVQSKFANLVAEDLPLSAVQTAVADLAPAMAAAAAVPVAVEAPTVEPVAAASAPEAAAPSVIPVEAPASEAVAPVAVSVAAQEATSETPAAAPAPTSDEDDFAALRAAALSEATAVPVKAANGHPSGNGVPLAVPTTKAAPEAIPAG